MSDLLRASQYLPTATNYRASGEKPSASLSAVRRGFKRGAVLHTVRHQESASIANGVDAANQLSALKGSLPIADFLAD